jgi:hypothetical protein
MSKLKYLVVGMNNQELGQLINNLIGGEVEGPAEVLVCNGNPQSFTLDPATGAVKTLPFDKFLSDVVRHERRKLSLAGPGEALIKDIVKARAEKKEAEKEKAANQG